MAISTTDLIQISNHWPEVPGRPESHATTLLGTPILPVQKGLPKVNESICPECIQVIPARIFEEEGRVMIEKQCSEHGYFKDVVWSDVRLYLKAERWAFEDGKGITNPAVPDAVSCPADCGICQMHVSHTGLANVDLTNRCDLTCPVCFANANAAGFVYEPTLEQTRKMLRQLREMQPVAGRVIQFSGGEPTLHPHFLEALKTAKELGFSHIQVATNGIRFGSEPGFAESCAEAGLHTLYLQFDGLSDDIYRKTRGKDLWAIKQAAVEAVRRAGMKIVLVPTVVRGINDHAVGAILQYALDNIDVVSAITYQPVAFTGRIARRQRQRMRYTLTDLVQDLASQTGIVDDYHDWYPTPCTASFSRFISALRGQDTTALTCHPHCSLATYLFVDGQSRTAVPITRFVDVEGMLRSLNEKAQQVGKSRFKKFNSIVTFHTMRKYFKEENAPPGMTYTRLLQTLEGLVDKRAGRGKSDGTYTYKTLLISGMHFQDSYNYQVDRIKRCVVHYSAPDGRIYPFCSYNSGPVFRERIEKQFSQTFGEYRASHGDAVGIPRSNGPARHDSLG